MFIGFMGTGKTTVSHYYSLWKGLKELDMDQEIVKRKGMAIPDIFERFGEEHFRDLESELIVELQRENNLLISCGGGIVLRSENVKNMKKLGKIILLTASPDTVLQRVKDGKDRPVLNGNMNAEYIEQLMEKRREKYEQAADIIINTDDKNVSEICEEIALKLK